VARKTILLALAVSLCTLWVSAETPNLAAAIEQHRLLAQESPTPGVLNDLANLLVLDGSHGEAESIYRRVLSMDHLNSEARFNLGLLLRRRGMLDEAEGLFISIVESSPSHAWAYYQLGAIHEQRDERDEAIDAYAHALALDPQLFFADVNPQVVRNQLLTESLLQAAQLREAGVLAPMQYARPREITRMLLSLGTTPAPEETASSTAGDEVPDDELPEDHGGTPPPE